MLFDLRGAGRRRTIRVVYLVLALVFASGALIGIGSGYSIEDAFNGGSGSSGNSALTKQAKTLQKRVQQNPQAAADWAKLARTQFQLAAATIDQTTGQYTKDGRTQLAQAAAAWNKYLSLNPEKPDATVAALMVQTFVQIGQASKAAEAQEIVTSARPNRNAYILLAKLAYAGGLTRKGDLAATKALEATPKDLRGTVKAQLDQAKKAGAAKGGQPGQSATPATPTTTG